MRDLLLTISCMLFSALATPVAAAETYEAPLHNDISVGQVADDYSAEHAALLGLRADGLWNGVLCSALVAQDMDSEGNVRFVYSWGTYAGWNVLKGRARGVGRMDGNTIRMTFHNGAKVSYARDGD